VSRRTERVEELLRREIADILLRGELRDPRLAPVASLSITGARVSADLSHARVFVDVMPPPAVEGPGARVSAAMDERRIARVLEGFAASAGLIRAKLQQRIDIRRVPELRFEHDDAVERGARIETVLSELEAERRRQGEHDNAVASTVDDDVD